MGGCIALAFAAAYPARTAALALIDTTAWYGAEAPAQWAERGSRAATAGKGALGGVSTTRWFGDGFLAPQPPSTPRSRGVVLLQAVSALALFTT